ncbi:hypothetical protein PMAYCL1PPCAC_19830, partial [Pristionchus mayeri]
DFSTLLIMSANLREVYIDVNCISITATDLMFLRNSMEKGDCKMETFSARIDKGVREEFLHACFHITMILSEEFDAKVEFCIPPLTPHPTKLYSGSASFNIEQVHFTDNLMTVLWERRIKFKRIS